MNDVRSRRFGHSASRSLLVVAFFLVQCTALPALPAPPTALAPQIAHAASTITQWTFAGDVSTPAAGTGTATLIGGTSATFAAGFAGGGDRAWSTSGYPSQGTGSKTAGAQFAVSTIGFSGIAFGFEHYHSNTAANTLVVQVSTDGGASFTDVQTFTQSAATTWVPRTVDLSTNLAIQNNANAVFRVVSAFASGSVYSATGTTYGTSGAIRFDDVTVNGTAISGDLPPVAQSTSPFNGASNVPVNSNIAITFSEPVTTTGNWFSIACASSGTRSVADAAISGGPTTFTINPNVDFTSGEACTATVFAAQVTDQDGTPDAMPADATFGFTAATNACTLPFTHTYEVQGTTDTSPLSGTVVSVQGVVVGDYEGPSPALRGFFVQDQTGDGNANTSDGLFVFNGSNISTTVGQIVRVSGTVQEFQGQTQLSSPVTVLSCNATATITPTDVTLPVTSTTALEKYEGMLVRLPQMLFVTEHFQLGRFGQVTLSSGDRLRQPTMIAAPGAPAQAVQAQNDLNQIILDDSTNAQNPDPIVFGRGTSPLSAANTLRGGDTVSNVVGVMTYGWAGANASPNAYRVRPTTQPVFIASNPRPAIPAPITGTLTSTLKVASVNLLNYFNTFAAGTCTFGVGGPVADCRGAESQAEFDRQAPKTVANIIGTGADIISFMEMQNNGYGSASAMQELVNRLNAATAPNTYAFIDADARTGITNVLGVDAIRVGLIYKPASATPVGNTAALNTGAFGLYTTQVMSGGVPITGTIQRNRPALAQTFVQTGTGDSLTVVVAHLKSKGTACDDNVSPVGPDPDAGDGQGNCNLTRKAAAQQLVQWLATNPTGVVDPDVLVVGDFNAYAKEDPVTAMKAGGFNNIIEQRFGNEAYSYAFDAQWGYLDYAFASQSLTAKIAGMSEWHINADEPGTLDYNTNFKSVGQQASLYAADAFRSSDHDPVVVGIAGGRSVAYLPLVVSK